MKILFLAKRFYMRHDTPVDRYGRLYYLPYELAGMTGNEVLAFSVAYHKASQLQISREGDLTWQSLTCSPAQPGSLFFFLRKLYLVAQNYAPDVVIASSDVLNIILGQLLAKRIGCPFVADLYDNYESFGMARIPGLRGRYRRALSQADAVTCVSEPLSEFVRQRYRPSGPVVTIETTVDTEIFKPGDQIEARKSLGLPLDAKLIGLAGSLGVAHGVDTLYQAFDMISYKREDVHLVLAGQPDRQTPLPGGARIHFLGKIPNQQVVTLYQALDLSMICVRDTAFGRYSFPQKTYEILACKRPVLATDVGAMSSLFNNHPQCLYREDDVDDMVQKIMSQIDEPVVPDITVPTWAQQASRVNELLGSLVGGR